MSAYVAGTLLGLRAARELDFVVKLDTDAAIIRPFSEAIERAFGDPELGVVGSYDRTSDGGTRDWSVWREVLDQADRPLSLWRTAKGIRINHRPRAHRLLVRSVRQAAYRFAPPGAHCLGGAYAVSAEFLRSAQLDWSPWTRTRLSEDVVVGLLSSAAGLRMRSLTGTGEPFAVSWRGLPSPPAEIVAHGHSIVHSVKCDEEGRESELRELLQTLTTRT
jgi:hypothetical protein